MKDDDVLLSTGWDKTEPRRHQQTAQKMAGEREQMGAAGESETSHLNS